MTRRTPRCPAQWQPPGATTSMLAVRCQLEAGHDGDHAHTSLHQNATHTTAWIDNINELAHSRRRRRQARR